MAGDFCSRKGRRLFRSTALCDHCRSTSMGPHRESCASREDNLDYLTGRHAEKSLPVLYAFGCDLSFILPTQAGWEAGLTVMMDGMTRLTFHGHACVRVENARGDVLVIDPGMEELCEPDALVGVRTVLVTHAHVDHLDAERLVAAAELDPELRVYAGVEVARRLADLGDRVRVLRVGEGLFAGGFEVSVHGGRHATSHPDYPPAENLGFLVNGEVFHPGDALVDPGVPVRYLLCPVDAPWLRFPDMPPYVRALRPDVMIPIHFGLLNDVGVREIRRGIEATVFPETAIRWLAVGECVDLGVRRPG